MHTLSATLKDSLLLSLLQALPRGPYTYIHPSLFQESSLRFLIPAKVKVGNLASMQIMSIIAAFLCVYLATVKAKQVQKLKVKELKSRAEGQHWQNTGPLSESQEKLPIHQTVRPSLTPNLEDSQQMGAKQLRKTSSAFQENPRRATGSLTG